MYEYQDLPTFECRIADTLIKDGKEDCRTILSATSPDRLAQH